MNRLLLFCMLLCAFNFVHSQQGFIYNANVRVSYRLYEIPQTWLNAKITCDESGSKLAMPKNVDEARVMLNLYERYLNSTTPEDPDANLIYLNSHQWFDLEDFVTDGYHLEYFYHNWRDKMYPGGLASQRCLTMDVKGEMDTKSCSMRLVYFCQIEDSPYVESLKNTKSRAVLSKDPTYTLDSVSKKYFKLHLDAKKWGLARRICHAEGGRLAIIENKNQEDFIKGMYNQRNPWFLETTDFAYIGYHDYFQAGLYYTVADRQLNDLGYVNWASGQPNSTNSFEKCVAIDKAGQLSILDCTKETIFFCERTFN